MFRTIDSISDGAGYDLIVIGTWRHQRAFRSNGLDPELTGFHHGRQQR